MLIMGAVRMIVDTFWSEHVWLPPNTTWADLEKNDVIRHTDYRDLIYPLPMALVLLLVRYVFERYWFAPIGLSLGIKNSRQNKAPLNAVLEKAYASKGKIKHKQIKGLAKQLDWTERQVERWLRLRHSQDKPSTLTKFCENSWRCFYYFSAFHYGVFCLWDKPWLWDINQCWYGYPHQSLTEDVWWYYMISLSFYWSLTVSQFTDVRRKDFWQMFIHHMAAISLLSFSWICNLTRIGTLVLLVHDIADILLEAAKMAKYSGYQRVCDAIFAIFTVTWILTRLGVYPFWIIYSTTVEAPIIVAMFPAYYIFNSLLILLLLLHVIWTYLILKIVSNSLKAGQMEGDIRSSSCDDVSSEEKPGAVNGVQPKGRSVSPPETDDELSA